MTAIVPHVYINNVKTQIINRPGMAGKIAVIGAFDSTETNPHIFATVGEAQDTFGDDTTYNGCAVVPYLFTGASSLLAVNITTKSGQTVDKSITVEKLTSALSKIKGEDWDILFIADILTDAFLPVITAFLDECYHLKYPAGYVGALNGSTTSANVTSAGLAGDHCYGLLTQTFSIGGVSVNNLLSSAYYCGQIAGMNVGNTMTMKEIAGVTGVSPEYTFETGDAGKALLEAGITTVKCQDRGNGRYVVVNSEQPNGYDLYINRVRDFVVKEFALHQSLGERNRPKTHDEIKQELSRVKNQCVKTLDLLEDINYTVVKVSPQCVDVNIDSLLFAGIITTINVNVRIEVE